MTQGTVAVDPPHAIDGVRPRTGRGNRACRSPGLVAALLVLVCASACESTTVPGLNIRAEPTTASRIVDRMAIAGTAVVVVCFTRGQSIHGQALWYRITSPHVGYVTAYYVQRDSDTLATTRPC